MKLIAGVDIGNSTTEVCIGSVGEDGRFQFLSSASRITTGTKGTLPNVHGVKAALEEAMKDKNLLVMAVPSVFLRHWKRSAVFHFPI